MLNANEIGVKEGYIDMHCHIIPHVDDGAKNSSQALSMVTQAYQNGFRAMIATPHYEVGRYEANREDIDKNYLKLKHIVEQNMPDMRIYQGNEVFFSYGVVEKLNEGEIYTLAGSNYVLVEFSPNDSFSYIKKSLYEIINGGYTPILAHTERYEEVMEAEIKNVEKLVDAGVLIQINSSTLAGNMGITVRRKVVKLIKNDLVHFISTDCHSDGRRSPDITECIKYLQKKVDDEVINRLLRDNAIKVINNEEIE